MQLRPTSIAMAATTATDDTAGVEYYFEDFNNPAVQQRLAEQPGMAGHNVYTQDDVYIQS